MPGFLTPEHVGRPLLGIGWYAQGFLALLRYFAMHLPALVVRPTRLVFFKQVYFTGIEALGAVGIIAVLSGIVITTQTTSLVGVNATLTAKILLWTVVRELGPLLTAIIIVARSASATASELAGMKIRGELGSLRQMGIEPMDYLIVPRIAGITLSVMAVTFYFQMLAVVAGIGFTALTRGIPFAGTLGSVVSLLTLGEVAASFLKMLVFGLVVSITSCYYGLRAPATATAIPQAATMAVVHNLLTVFFLDGLISYAVFL